MFQSLKILIPKVEVINYNPQLGTKYSGLSYLYPRTL